LKASFQLLSLMLDANMYFFTVSSRRIFDLITEGLPIDPATRKADKNVYVRYWKQVFNYYRRSMAGSFYKNNKQNATRGLLKNQDDWAVGRTPPASKRKQRTSNPKQKKVRKTAVTPEIPATSPTPPTSPTSANPATTDEISTEAV
jgi:hypothetical protein